MKVTQPCLTLCDPLYSPWNSPGQNTGVGRCFFLQGDLPNPGIKPRSPALQADSLPAESPGKPKGRRLSDKELMFKLWCWRRLLRVPWTARRSNQSILEEINRENSLERLMLKLQYFGYLMQRPNSLKKTLMLGKTRGRKRR